MSHESMPSTSSSSVRRRPIVYLMASAMTAVTTPDYADSDEDPEGLVAEGPDPAAIEQSVDATGAVRGREDPRQHGADDAADQVHAHDVERVVVAELELQADRPGADRSGDGADRDRTLDVDRTRRPA